MEINAAETAIKTNENSVRPQNRSGKIISVIALIFGFLSFISVIILAVILNNASENERHRLSRVHALLTQQQQSVTNIETALQTFNQSQAKRTRALTEAEYLVQLANLNLTFAGDIPSAIDLLKAADQQLAASADSSLIHVRQTLANNIAALQTLPKFDLPGLILQINALSQQINRLPIVPSQLSKSTPESANTTNTPQPQVSIWKRGFAAAGHALKDMVIVRHLDQPAGPLLPPEQQAYLVQNIQSKLAQAEWAALHRQPQLYQTSLQQAESWIRQYFVQSATITETVLQNLADLQKVNVKPNLPDIAATLKEIQDASGKSMPIKASAPSSTTQGSSAL